MGHEWSHFLKRMFVILRCSSAASRNSVASSFARRRRRISNISLADLPVAHTMNTLPKRCSYARLPSAKANWTSCSAVITLDCSSADQAAESTPAVSAAFRSPIRGCFEKASLQSELVRAFQISSEPEAKLCSSSIGRLDTSLRAHETEPQHGKISCAASSSDS